MRAYSDNSQVFVADSYFTASWVRVLVIAAVAVATITAGLLSRDVLTTALVGAVTLAATLPMLLFRGQVVVGHDDVSVAIGPQAPPYVIPRSAIQRVERRGKKVVLHHRAEAMFGGSIVIRQLVIRPHNQDACIAAIEGGTMASGEETPSVVRNPLTGRAVWRYLLVLAAALAAGVIISRL